MRGNGPYHGISFKKNTHEDHGHPRGPWTPTRTMDTHEDYGRPRGPWTPTRTMDTHEDHGRPRGPWTPMRTTDTHEDHGRKKDFPFSRVIHPRVHGLVDCDLSVDLRNVRSRSAGVAAPRALALTEEEKKPQHVKWFVEWSRGKMWNSFHTRHPILPCDAEHGTLSKTGESKRSQDPLGRARDTRKFVGSYRPNVRSKQVPEWRHRGRSASSSSRDSRKTSGSHPPYNRCWKTKLLSQKPRTFQAKPTKPTKPTFSNTFSLFWCEKCFILQSEGRLQPNCVGNVWRSKRKKSVFWLAMSEEKSVFWLAMSEGKSVFWLAMSEEKSVFWLAMSEGKTHLSS